VARRAAASREAAPKKTQITIFRMTQTGHVVISPSFAIMPKPATSTMSIAMPCTIVRRLRAAVVSSFTACAPRVCHAIMASPPSEHISPKMPSTWRTR